MVIVFGGEMIAGTFPFARFFFHIACEELFEKLAEHVADICFYCFCF